MPGAANGLAEAAQRFAHVVKLDSSHILAAFLLAQALYSQGLIKEAISQYKQVLALRRCFRV